MSTPREVKSIFDAAARRAIHLHNERAWLAWHTAALTRSTKRMPNLDKMLVKQTAVIRQRQTWQQQLAIMDMWVAATKRRSDQAPRIN